MGTLGRRTISIILSVLMVLSCFTGMTFSVGAETSGDYEYEVLDDGTVSITKYNGSDTDVTIPSELDGKKVTEIRSNDDWNGVFSYSVERVSIPDSVTTIGCYAFSRCWRLKSVEIPDSITKIEGFAFDGCTKLESISIPDGVTEIGFHVFASCEGLTNIKIPDNVTTIRDYAFFGCTGLTNVTIPDSVLEIGEAAFRECRGLTSITIGNSVRKIDRQAFYECKSLTSITIPDSVTIIGDSVFDLCRGLKEINVNDGNQKYKSIDGVLFNKAITEIKAYPSGREGGYVIPDSVTTIGDHSFYECTELESVTIPVGVTTIDSWAFCGCSRLSNVVIPNSVEKIGDHSFDDCTGLASITIPDSVTSIGNSAFEGCTGLTSITIPESITSIGYSTFAGCTGLTSITIPESITSIGYSAFAGCTGLTSVIIPDSVTSISDSVFYGCTGLTSVTIPDSVTEIGDYAFKGCAGLTSITIPDSVTKIGKVAFAGCTGFASVTIPSSVIKIGYNAFGYYYKKVNNNVYVIKRDSFTIKGYTGSEAEKYATDNGFTFVALSSCEHITTELRDAKEATCTEKGYTGDKVCVNCEFLVEKGVEIPALGHNETIDEIDSITFSVNPDSLVDDEIPIKDARTDPTVSSEPKLVFDSSFDFKTRTLTLDVSIVNAKGHAAVTAFVDFSADKLEYVSAEEFEDISYMSAAGLTEDSDSILTAAAMSWDVFTENTIKLATFTFKVKDLGKPATCTEKGFTEGTKCSVCGEVIKAKKDIPPLGHKEVKIEGKPATCTEKGLTDGAKCSVCSEITTAQEIIPSLGHSFENYISDNNATCTKDGTKTAKCERCDVTNTLTDVGSATGHTLVTDEAVAPTCTKTGLTEGSHCSVCNEIIVKQEIIPSLGHSFENYISDNNATCTKDGTKTAKCERCNVTNTLTDVGTAKGHTLVTDNAVAPTCTKTGLTEGSHCSVCNKIIVKQEIIPSLGHSFENYISDNNATCTKDGTKTAKCERCDVTNTLTDVGTATGHTLVTDEAAAPTCTKTGLTEGSHCSVCNEIIVKQETVPALGHDFSNEWTIDKEASCTENGSKSHHCSRCDEKSDITVIEAPGHNYGEWIITSEATCKSAGSEYRTCDVCGYKEKRTIDKLEHNFGEWVVMKKSTVLSDGLNQRICKDCGTVESEVLSKIEIDIDTNSGYGRADFTVVNAQTLKPIKNANIFISTANDGENTFKTDENGNVSVVLPVGKQTVSVYADGCLTRNVSVKIESGINTVPQIGLSDKPVYEAKVTHHLMTADEIEEAGIDVSAADNNHTYKYELNLEFEPGIDWASLIYYWGESGTIYGGSGTAHDSGSGGGSGSETPVTWVPASGGKGGGYFLIPRGNGEAPLSVYPVSEHFYLIIRGEVKWLKEMFDVEMLVVNNSNTDTLEDLTATLNLPEGLSLADMSGEQQTLEQEIGHVDSGSTKSVHWYVRGDKAGSYPIEARLHGKVMPFDEEIDDVYSAENSLQVWAGDALNLHFEFPNAAYYGEDYPITITLTNVSDITLYNVGHIITGIEQGRVTHYSDGKKEEEVYMSNGTVGSGFAQEFKPGDKIVMELSVNILFESKLMEYKLQKMIGIVDDIEKLLAFYNLYNVITGMANSLNGSISGCTGALDAFTGNVDWESIVTGADRIEKIKLFNTLREKIAGLASKYGTSGDKTIDAAFKLTNTSLGHALDMITEDPGTWLKGANIQDIKTVLDQVSALENSLTGSASTKSRKFDIFDSIRTAISAIPINFVLSDVVMVEDEDNTTSIPWSYSVSEASPQYFGVSSVSKYIMALTQAACGEVLDNAMPWYLKLIPGLDDPLNYKDAVKYIQATEDEIALVKAKDATGEIKFKCWVESADTENTSKLKTRGASDSIQNDFILECDNETAVFENGVLTFTGDGLISITPKTTNGGVLHIEDSKGNTYIYEINVVRQHECTAGEREVIVSPTDDYDGFAVKCCTVCGEIMDIETLSVSECSSHNFGEWTNEVESTCETAGIRTRSCFVCGYSQVEYTDALGHREVTIPGKPASCTQNGLTDGVKCSVCGEIITAQEEIPSLGGHKEVKIEGSPATCTESGLTDGVKCSVCGEIIKAQEEIPALGHEDGDEDGICDICGEEIKPDADCDKNGHIDSDNDGVCDNCGDVMPEVKNCKCICHKKGFAGFIYKIIRLLWRLFGMKKVCDCGLSHY